MEAKIENESTFLDVTSFALLIYSDIVLLQRTQTSALKILKECRDIKDIATSLYKKIV